MPVSADPGFVKRYSTPASLSVCSSNIPPVPGMVLAAEEVGVHEASYEALVGHVDAPHRDGGGDRRLLGPRGVEGERSLEGAKAGAVGRDPHVLERELHARMHRIDGPGRQRPL